MTPARNQTPYSSPVITCSIFKPSQAACNYTKAAGIIMSHQHHTAATDATLLLPSVLFILSPTLILFSSLICSSHFPLIHFFLSPSVHTSFFSYSLPSPPFILSCFPHSLSSFLIMCHLHFCFILLNLFHTCSAASASSSAGLAASSFSLAMALSAVILSTMAWALSLTF